MVSIVRKKGNNTSPLNCQHIHFNLRKHMWDLNEKKKKINNYKLCYLGIFHVRKSCTYFLGDSWLRTYSKSWYALTSPNLPDVNCPHVRHFRVVIVDSPGILEQDVAYRPARTVFLCSLPSFLVTKFIIQLIQTVQWALGIPQTHTSASLHWGCWFCDGETEGLCKICFLFLFSVSFFCLFVSILARTCTPTLHMSCNANSMCGSCQGQRINGFSRIDNIEGRTWWQRPDEATICIFQNTWARHLNDRTPWLQGRAVGSSPLFSLVPGNPGDPYTWSPPSIKPPDPEQRQDSCSFPSWVSQKLRPYLLSLSFNKLFSHFLLTHSWFPFYVKPRILLVGPVVPPPGPQSLPACQYSWIK